MSFNTQAPQVLSSTGLLESRLSSPTRVHTNQEAAPVDLFVLLVGFTRTYATRALCTRLGKRKEKLGLTPPAFGIALWSKAPAAIPNLTKSPTKGSPKAESH